MIEYTFDQLPTAVSRLHEKIDLLLSRSNEIRQTDSDKLLTVEEAAAFLHYSQATIYGYISKKTIPSTKRGKRRYFSQKELMEWVKSGREKTINEINAEVTSYLVKKK